MSACTISGIGDEVGSVQVVSASTSSDLSHRVRFSDESTFDSLSNSRFGVSAVEAEGGVLGRLTRQRRATTAGRGKEALVHGVHLRRRPRAAPGPVRGKLRPARAGGPRSPGSAPVAVDHVAAVCPGRRRAGDDALSGARPSVMARWREPARRGFKDARSRETVAVSRGSPTCRRLAVGLRQREYWTNSFSPTRHSAN